MFLSNENDFKIPDSAIIKHTIEFLKDTHQQFLINHCFRTYIFGNIYSKKENIAFDKELLAIASLLHDIGLTHYHQNKHSNCNCFAIEGAIETGLFLESLEQMEKDKIETIQNAIALHLNIKVSKNLPEAYLLNKGAAIDVIGKYYNNFPAETMSKIIQNYSRLQFKNKIHALLKQQCTLRPQSRMSLLYQHGFDKLIKHSAFDD
ncbi:HD domain-containing protein [Flavobacterium sp. ZT3R18]|uniref:HD domain-containing protein n=1 Tax=Flavobacterium sp. ZT3R18 TaxID=2594429 RepID=UPI00163D4A15|nr:HD domain-containing protein [Flavobacterium sp. ZT3R18]